MLFSAFICVLISILYLKHYENFCVFQAIIQIKDFSSLILILSVGDFIKFFVQIGIIGGSGLDDPDILEERTERYVDTPYGKVSCVL